MKSHIKIIGLLSSVVFLTACVPCSKRYNSYPSNNGYYGSYQPYGSSYPSGYGGGYSSPYGSGYNSYNYYYQDNDDHGHHGENHHHGGDHHEGDHHGNQGDPTNWGNGQGNHGQHQPGPHPIPGQHDKRHYYSNDNDPNGGWHNPVVIGNDPSRNDPGHHGGNPHDNGEHNSHVLSQPRPQIPTHHDEVQIHHSSNLGDHHGFDEHPQSSPQPMPTHHMESPSPVVIGSDPSSHSHHGGNPHDRRR